MAALDASARAEEQHCWGWSSSAFDTVPVAADPLLGEPPDADRSSPPSASSVDESLDRDRQLRWRRSPQARRATIPTNSTAKAPRMASETTFSTLLRLNVSTMLLHSGSLSIVPGGGAGLADW